MFKCDKCGLCCRNLKQNELYQDLDRGDGVCIYLQNNLCSIYETRPLKCRIDDSFYLFKDYLTLEEYYTMNYEACKLLKDKTK